MDKRKSNSVHVTLTKNGQWAVKKAGNERASSLHATQQEAHDAAKVIAKKERLELVVHGKNGKIRIKNSFGNDPRGTKG